MTRQEANREILKHISQQVEQNPDWRFHQLLQNMRVSRPAEDQWYEESESTLAAIVEKPGSDSDKVHSLSELVGKPTFVGDVADWNEFDDCARRLDMTRPVGYMILKRDSMQYFGLAKSGWIDVSEDFKKHKSANVIQ